MSNKTNPFSGLMASTLDPFNTDRLGELERERDQLRAQFQQERADNQALRATINRVTNDPRLAEMTEMRNNSNRALEVVRKQVSQLTEFVECLNEKPQAVVTVQKRIDKKYGLITFQGNAMRVNLPEGTEAGDQVMVLTDTGQPVEKTTEPLAFGVIVTVDRVEKDRCFFDGNGGGQLSAYVKTGVEVSPGDRVQLDPSSTVALANLGRDKTRFSIEKCPDVKWEDIGGHEEAKEAFREALEYPTKYSSVYGAYGSPTSKGVLLYGPPGTGKTMLAKAAANSVSSDGRGGFIYLKGPEVLSKWVGESETTIRSVFARARAHKAETGNLAVVFIDEADALLGVRGGQAGMSAMTSMLVPAFLAEMDGIEDSGAFVVLATNRPDSLDPAVVRDGRIDRRIRIGRPDRASTLDILKLQLKGKLTQAFNPEQIVNEIWDEKYGLYVMEFSDHHITVGLSDMLSGAVLGGFVKRASNFAIKRDLKTKATGISCDDMLHAVAESFKELSAVSPNDLFMEKADLYGKPTSIKKVNFNAGTKTKEVGRAVAWGNAVQRA